jgi:hypothetical protein
MAGWLNGKMAGVDNPGAIQLLQSAIISTLHALGLFEKSAFVFFQVF